VIKFEPRHGDRLRLVGTWARSEYSGEDEFIFSRCSICIPTDARAALEYAAEITRGIGPAVRQKIWSEYGEDWRAHPDLDGVGGISETVRAAWRETLRRLEIERAKTDTMGHLLSLGCSMSLAERAWEAWGEGAVGRVTADPYCLTEIPRVGFLTVENAGIPRALGIADDDPRRLRAATLYAMDDITARAGTLVAIEELIEHPALVRISAAARSAVKGLIDAGALVTMDNVGVECVALKRDYEAERTIAEWAA